uniref:SUEL-type lectin domain-containing protein n=1 Tax=Sinocyclocheilus rhinocerous TaxID=307959 RepID=A0A673G8M0_9TELE
VILSSCLNALKLCAPCLNFTTILSFSIFYYMCSDLGFIKVLEANYGRTDHITCANGSPTNVISNKHCFLETSLHTMCDGRKNCSVPAVNSVFSDPCSRTFKYLDVSYDCIPASKPVLMVAQITVLKCAVFVSKDTGVISVYHANYGRRDLVTCPHKSATSPDCYSPQTRSLRSRCNGRKSCQLNASNSVYSDPCYGVYKYLDVIYMHCWLLTCACIGLEWFCDLIILFFRRSFFLSL